jgi:hypothetical protein
MRFTGSAFRLVLCGGCYISQGMPLVSQAPLVPMPVASLAFAAALRPAQMADLRVAAAKMTGATRRACEAERAFK